MRGTAREVTPLVTDVRAVQSSSWLHMVSAIWSNVHAVGMGSEGGRNVSDQVAFEQLLAQVNHYTRLVAVLLTETFCSLWSGSLRSTGAASGQGGCAESHFERVASRCLGTRVPAKWEDGFSSRALPAR